MTKLFRDRNTNLVVHLTHSISGMRNSANAAIDSVDITREIFCDDVFKVKRKSRRFYLLLMTRKELYCFFKMFDSICLTYLRATAPVQSFERSSAQ
jgi:hypothetical protein